MLHDWGLFATLRALSCDCILKPSYCRTFDCRLSVYSTFDGVTKKTILYLQQRLRSIQTMRSMFPIKQGMRRTLYRQSTCTNQTTCKLHSVHLSELSCFPFYTLTLTPNNIVSCERFSQITCD